MKSFSLQEEWMGSAIKNKMTESSQPNQTAIVENNQVAVLSESNQIAFLENVYKEMEIIFKEIGQFEECIRLTRRDFISRISNCLDAYSISEIPLDSVLFRKLFLLYVKCVRSNVNFRKEGNLQRFKSVVDMEEQFDNLKLQNSTVIALRYSKRRSRTDEENEIVRIHSDNFKQFRGLLRAVFDAKSTAKADVVIMDDDEDDELTCRVNKSRDYLAQLITDHANLSKETFWSTVESGNWLADGIIDFFVQRILQPISDERDLRICFQPCDIYEDMKRGDPIEQTAGKILRRINVELVKMFVHPCNTPNHWITVIVDMSKPGIYCYDSLQSTLSEKNSIVLKKFAQLYDHIFSRSISWTFQNPLTERLQDNGDDCGVWSILFAECAFDGNWSQEKLKAFDIEAERKRIKSESLALVNCFKAYHESFTHEGGMYAEPNPESARLVLDAIINSECPQVVERVSAVVPAVTVKRDIETLDDGPSDNVSSIAADLDSVSITTGFSNSNIQGDNNESSTKKRRSHERDLSFRLKDTKITPLTLTLRSTGHRSSDADEFEWDDTMVEITKKEAEEVEMEVEDKVMPSQDTLPSQEDLLDLTPIPKRQKLDDEVVGAKEFNWNPSFDESLLRLQIGISFLRGYEFKEKPLAPMDRAVKIFQCAVNFIEYRDTIERMVDSIKRSGCQKEQKHYRIAFQRLVDSWNIESDTLSEKYMTMKNKIPDFVKEKIANMSFDPNPDDVMGRIDVIYDYLGRDREVPVRQLVDVLKPFLNKQSPDSSLTTSLLHISDMNLEQTVTSEQTASSMQLGKYEHVVSLERLNVIGASFNTAGLSESEYEYPKSVIVGMTNTGNSCFMNVILQILWRIKRLLHEMYSLPTTSNRVLVDTITELYSSVVDSQSIITKKYMITVRKAIMSGINMENNYDQDATEFLLNVLAKLDLELTIPYKNLAERVQPFSYFEVIKDKLQNDWLGFFESHGYSIVKDLFFSSLINVYKCCNCGFETLGHSEYCSSIMLSINTGQSIVSMLDQYFEREVVSPNIKSCLKCKSDGEHFRYPYLGRTPPILVIQIIRNEVILKEDQCEMQKNVMAFDISFDDLDISKYCILNRINPKDHGGNKLRYKLSAMVCHVAASPLAERTRSAKGKASSSVKIQTDAGMHLGHYYMYTKDFADKWVECDDSKCVIVEEEKLLTDNQAARNELVMVVYS